MGYNYATGFLPPTHHPTLGLNGFKAGPVTWDEAMQMASVGPKPKPKIEIIIDPVNIGPKCHAILDGTDSIKTKAQLLALRAKWVETFLGHFKPVSPEMKSFALSWIDKTGALPKTAMQLHASLMDPTHIETIALACLEACLEG